MFVKKFYQFIVWISPKHLRSLAVMLKVQGFLMLLLELAQSYQIHNSREQEVGEGCLCVDKFLLL